ncbi:unnamed protein product [Effrenium voratum]|uniref:Macro domain-containing protein n=1 Tax=Effrenium voratum TaxID=2562239 RepID=A0AA36JB01_9DINO|nr:unnamed protein product [Effrenium voratum]
MDYRLLDSILAPVPGVHQRAMLPMWDASPRWARGSLGPPSGSLAAEKALWALIRCQKAHMKRILRELDAGSKSSCWAWYIFPRERAGAGDFDGTRITRQNAVHLCTSASASDWRECLEKICGLLEVLVYLHGLPALAAGCMQTCRELICHYRLFGGCDVEFRFGDILSNELGVKALVNSANGQLLLPDVAGIAGAIKRRGGVSLVNECEQILSKHHRVEVGEVAVTDAHGLREAGFDKIFHAVPPVYEPTQKAGRDMEATVRAVLTEVGQAGLDSVVLPILGAGIFGWRADCCALIDSILYAISSWDLSGANKPKRIVIMDTNHNLIKDLAVAAASRFGKAFMAICHRPGCSNQSWNGQPGEFCTLRQH